MWKINYTSSTYNLFTRLLEQKKRKISGVKLRHVDFERYRSTRDVGSLLKFKLRLI